MAAGHRGITDFAPDRLIGYIGQKNVRASGVLGIELRDDTVEIVLGVAIPEHDPRKSLFADRSEHGVYQGVMQLGREVNETAVEIAVFRGWAERDGRQDQSVNAMFVGGQISGGFGEGLDEPHVKIDREMRPLLLNGSQRNNGQPAGFGPFADFWVS
jgi:hypothetical protein